MTGNGVATPGRVHRLPAGHSSDAPCDEREGMPRKNHLPLPVLTPEDAARFWACVLIGTVERCWPWKGYCNKDGYGQIKFHSKTYIASRIAYYLVTGKDPGDDLVCHTCDNPPCCNGAHFFVGTPQSNVADAASKGRMASGERHVWKLYPEKLLRGEDNAASKYNEQLVKDIRAFYVKRKRGHTLKDCEARFQVDFRTVWDIVNYHIWTHI